MSFAISRFLGLAVCAAVVFGSLTASPLAASLDPLGAHGDSSAAGATGDINHSTTVRYTYRIDSRGLAERIAAEGGYEARLREDLVVSLQLEERELFLPGQKKIQYFNEEHQVVREEPILARRFAGTVEGTGTPVSLVVAPEGLYGTIRHDGITYSLQPVSWRDGNVMQESVWDLPSEIKAPEIESPPRSSSQDLALAAGYYNLIVWPVAEPYWRALQPDYQNRIFNAYGYAVTMWRSDVTIDISLHSIATPSQDFSAQACGSGWDNGMQDFQNDWVWNNKQAGVSAGVNSYGLFYGSDGRADLWGCAKVDCDSAHLGCLQPAGGPSVYVATHAVQAWDCCANDNYDASRSDHLGKAVHHELSHNAGENSHPSDGNCLFGNTYNLMVAQTSMACRGVWWTTQTKSEIQTYAHPRLTFG